MSSNSSSDESLHDVFNIEKQIQCETNLLDTKIHAKYEKLKIGRIQKIRKKKHRQDKSKQHKPQYEQYVENVYFEDKHRDKGNNNINTFCSKIRPLYNIRERCISFIKCKIPKKDTFHRYYVKNIDVNTLKEKDTIIKRTSVKETLKENEDDNIPSWSKNLEEEQKCITREYNERLTENPYNVELWLEYIQFQVLNILFCKTDYILLLIHIYIY